MHEQEEQACQGCGYPSYVGHALGCALNTEGGVVSDAEQLEDSKKASANNLLNSERSLGDRLRGRAREVALTLGIITASLMETNTAQAFEINTSSEAMAALADRGVTLTGEDLKFNKDGQVMRLNMDGKTKKVWFKIVQPENANDPPPVVVTAESYDGTLGVVTIRDGTRDTTSLKDIPPAKK